MQRLNNAQTLSVVLLPIVVMILALCDMVEWGKAAYDGTMHALCD